MTHLTYAWREACRPAFLEIIALRIRETVANFSQFFCRTVWVISQRRMVHITVLLPLYVITMLAPRGSGRPTNCVSWLRLAEQNLRIYKGSFCRG